jgi:hypothetical protein
MEIVETKKIKKWSFIARMMEVEHGVKGRTGKQCRERYFIVQSRWHNKLDPTVNGQDWKKDE